MASHINNLLRQAISTFGGLKDHLPQNLERLKHLLDKTEAAHVGFKGHELLREDIWKSYGKPPISYVDIYEDDLVSVGVFVLSPGMRLPLHDHPHMHGLIKVIAGTVQINSYTVLEDHVEMVKAQRHQPIIVNDRDPSCLLDPYKQNLHEIHSVNGTAAFLDILAPPYETLIPDIGPRKCTYFKPIQLLDSDKILLKIIECPPSFSTDTYPYQGPEINIHSQAYQNC